MESISTPWDISISLMGQYDFVVTDKLLQMMESQRRVNVNRTFDEKKSKETKEKYRLNEEFMNMLHQRLQTSIGTMVTVFIKAVISCAGVPTPFYAHP